MQAKLRLILEVTCDIVVSDPGTESGVIVDLSRKLVKVATDAIAQGAITNDCDSFLDGHKIEVERLYV